jgi:hypothetical protein
VVIRINVATAFEGGIPDSERQHLTDRERCCKPQKTPTATHLECAKVEDLQEKIVHAIKSKLALPGVQISPLHPILEATVRQDAKRLAPYLLSSCGSEFRSLLDLESIFSLVFCVIAEHPPSKAYEPLLHSLGCQPVLARGLAILACRIGRQTAEVAKCRKDVIAAIRVFTVPTTRRTTVLKKAAFLLEKSEDCSAVETIFYESNMPADEFIDLLHLIVGGFAVDRRRLAEILAAVSPALKTRSGRKPSAASAAHEFLLEHMQCGYTWDVENEDFSDPLTQATRIEFDDPDFSPRSARRRVVARQKTNRLSFQPLGLG